MKTINTGDWFELKNGDLCVTILTPWSTLYSRTRFNHSALISKIKYKGVVFTQAEQDQKYEKSTGGGGLCSEYKCPLMESSVHVGEEWLKPGIGILTHLVDSWTHLDERKTPGLDTKVFIDESKAVFETESPEIAGFAYKEKRIVTLNDDSIHLEIDLTNTGKKNLELYDYCHNFLSLGDNPVSPDWHLKLPILTYPDQNIPFENKDMIREPGGVSWKKTPKEPFYKLSYETERNDTSWTLYSDSCPLSITERDSFRAEHIAVWGSNYCVSPEVFHGIFLMPNEKTSWWREWTFSVE